MTTKKKVQEDETAQVEIELTKPFVCYPDGFTRTELTKGKQIVSGRVAKLAKDCGAVK